MAKNTYQLKGVVLKCVNFTENDKILTVYTDVLGKLTLRGRGVRSLKSRRFASSQELVYSDMLISEKNGQYTLEEAEPIESFFGIRQSFEAIALASYFSEVIVCVMPEGEGDDRVLSLLLNSLYLLSEKPDMPLDKIKAVFEWRLAVYLGFMPNLTDCSDCQKRENLVWFDIAGGSVLCGDCLESASLPIGERVLVPVNEGVLSLAAFVAESEARRMFSFRCEDMLLSQFAALTEKYLLYHLERSFETLSFFHTITEKL